MLREQQAFVTAFEGFFSEGRGLCSVPYVGSSLLVIHEKGSNAALMSMPGRCRREIDGRESFSCAVLLMSHW